MAHVVIHIIISRMPKGMNNINCQIVKDKNRRTASTVWSRLKIQNNFNKLARSWQIARNTITPSKMYRSNLFIY